MTSSRLLAIDKVNTEGTRGATCARSISATPHTIMAPINTCSGCQNPIQKKNDFLICCTCKCKYDVVCANVKNFSTMSTNLKNNWECPECLSKLPKSGNSNTPIRPSTSSVDVEDRARVSECSYVTERIKPKKPSNKGALESSSEDRLRELIRQEITSAVQSVIRGSVTSELKNINDQISGFRDSISFFNSQFEELRALLEEKSNVIAELKLDNAQLKSSVADLTNRLNTVESHMRESNIEITGVPEHRSENLIDTVIQLSKVVETSLTAEDIVHVTRVAKLDKDSTRPRAVIAKLRSSRQRDTILAAVSKFNKKNAQKKLASVHLGIGGPCSPVFVSEHLTPANKSLHAATRKKAKENAYKFVWVRNGRIYARKDENCQSILIRSPDSLKLIS